MSGPRRLGVLGGTFDPVHYGHLDAAAAAHRALHLDEVRFVPSADPPHRPLDPLASPFHRFAMVALAVSGHPAYRASDAELTRPGPSYTVETLRTMHREGWPPSQIFFIIGADAFAEIATWREFPAVLDAAHFVVIERPGVMPDDAVARTPALAGRVRTGTDTVDTGRCGVVLVHADTRPVSSTTIRARLAAGQSIADCTPPAVADHILAHQLYRRVDSLHGQQPAS